MYPWRYMRWQISTSSLRSSGSLTRRTYSIGGRVRAMLDRWAETLLVAGSVILTGCPRRAEPPPPPPLCRAITSAALPAGSPNGGWGVTLDVQGAVLVAHEARFRRLKM